MMRRYIPISALYGDNIVEKSNKTKWYQVNFNVYT